MPLIKEGEAANPLTCNRIAQAFPWDESAGLLRFPLYTYNDVTLIPQHSSVRSRKLVDTKALLVPGIELNSPIVSANMDTVTGAKMAIAIANLGGIGVVHRLNTIEQQANEVREVKTYRQYVIYDPIKIIYDHTQTAEYAHEEMETNRRGFVLIYDKKDQLLGIITPRNVRKADSMNDPLHTIWTPKIQLLTASPHVSMKDAKALMRRHEKEKLILTDNGQPDGKVVGVIADRDLRDIEKYPLAAIDNKGRLLVGAAIGVKDSGEATERAKELILAGVDVIFIDAAHGDHDMVDEVTQYLLPPQEIERRRHEVLYRYAKESQTVYVITGNYGNPNGVKRVLEEFGVSGVKVGVGPGALCRTRIVAHTGVPQWSAVVYCADVASRFGATVIADGGIRDPGQVAAAIGAGADTVMVGTYFAGSDESPGEYQEDDRTGKKYKVIRGMSTKSARRDFNIVNGEIEKDSEKIASEGVETRIEYKGKVEDRFNKLVGGLRSAVSYAGANTLDEYRRKALFGLQTPSGRLEGSPHVFNES